MIAEITDVLKESGLYAFSKEEARKERKPVVVISYMPKEKFVKMYTTPWIRKDIFSDSNNITYEDIIKVFKIYIIICVNLHFILTSNFKIKISNFFS